MLLILQKAPHFNNINYNNDNFKRYCLKWHIIFDETSTYHCFLRIVDCDHVTLSDFLLYQVFLKMIDM